MVNRVNHRRPGDGGGVVGEGGGTWWGGWRRGFKALLQLTNFTLGPDATLNTEIHKNSVRIKAPNAVNALKRKHESQINHYNHYNKQRRVLMANSTVCQSKSKPIVEPRRAKPKTCQFYSRVFRICFPVCKLKI